MALRRAESMETQMAAVTALRTAATMALKSADGSAGSRGLPMAVSTASLTADSSVYSMVALRAKRKAG